MPIVVLASVIFRSRRVAKELLRILEHRLDIGARRASAVGRHSDVEVGLGSLTHKGRRICSATAIGSAVR
jgi:hypothetical protein